MTALLIFACCLCDCQRAYGNAHVGEVGREERLALPTINCARCKRPTQHRFVETRPLTRSEEITRRNAARRIGRALRGEVPLESGVA